jgi:hypothetical protein
MQTLAPGAVESLPAPDEVRRELAVTVRRASLLRQLLRVAERKQTRLSPAALAELNCAPREGGCDASR